MTDTKYQGSLGNTHGTDSAAGPTIDQRLAELGGEGTDMSIEPREIHSQEVFSGPIFSVLDKLIELPQTDGSTDRIRRQLIHHDPCVVILVHDLAVDTYLLTREYRVGAGGTSTVCPPASSTGERHRSRPPCASCMRRPVWCRAVRSLTALRRVVGWTSTRTQASSTRVRGSTLPWE